MPPHNFGDPGAFVRVRRNQGRNADQKTSSGSACVVGTKQLACEFGSWRGNEFYHQSGERRFPSLSVLEKRRGSAGVHRWRAWDARWHVSPAPGRKLYFHPCRMRISARKIARAGSSSARANIRRLSPFHLSTSRECIRTSTEWCARKRWRIARAFRSHVTGAVNKRRYVIQHQKEVIR